MQVLVLLAAHAGQVVAKERLIQTVWPDTFVTDDVLTRAISELRRVFGDDAKESRFIQTIPKSGYRLIARVSNGAEETLPRPATPPPARHHTARRRSRHSPAHGIGPGERPRRHTAALMEAGRVGDRPRAGHPRWCPGVAPAARRHAGAARHDRRPALRTPRRDPEREYLTDGLTEETSASLGQIDPEHLSVKGRTSTRRYKRTPKVARGDRAGAGRRVSGGRVGSGRERPAARDVEADSRARPGADLGGVL